MSACATSEGGCPAAADRIGERRTQEGVAARRLDHSQPDAASRNCRPPRADAHTTLPSTPHDHLFRRVFSVPEHAEGELRSVLPADLVARVDWSTLALVPGTFVDTAAGAIEADLLFTVELEGRRAFVYVLLEHQTTSDPRMPLRLLRSMVRIWERHFEEHRDARAVPAILPVVVHHSAAGWTSARSLTELYDLPPSLLAVVGRHLPAFEIVLDDISLADDTALRSRTMTALGRVTLFSLARSRSSEDFVAELSRWSDALAEILDAPSGVAALRTLVSYALVTTETHPEQLRRLATQLGPKAEEAFMTGADILRAEGFQRGIEQGIEKGIERGIEKGRLEGSVELLLGLLAARFGELPEGVVRRVRGATAEDIERWARRVLTEATLDGVLG